jgi:hypothetical protein
MKKAKVSKYGQWKYPGQDTIIPNANGSITMKGVPYPVLGIDDRGNRKMMMPGGEYQFPGNSVYEIPMMAAGGIVNPCPPGQVPDGKGNCVDDLTTPPIPSSSLYPYYTEQLAKLKANPKFTDPDALVGQMIKAKRAGSCQSGECWEDEPEPVKIQVQSGPKEHYTIKDSGNPGHSYLWKYTDDGNSGYNQELIGSVFNRDFLNDEQQVQFDAPGGGTAVVNYDPNIQKVYSDQRDVWQTIEDERGVKQNAQNNLNREQQRIKEENAARELWEKQQREKQNKRIAEFAYGGAKKVKIKSLPKAQDLGELTPEQRKVYDNRYIYNRDYGFDTQESNDSALLDAQYFNSGPIYNVQSFLPDPKVIIPAGKKFPLEHINWDGYDSWQENYMSDPNYVSRYNKRTPEQQQEMKNQIDETENAKTYYNSLDAVKDWERNWYTKRAELPWFTDIANKRLNLSRDINMQPFGNDEEYKLRFPDTGGVFTTNGNYIGLPPDAWSNKNTMVHERSHWFDFNAPQNDDMYNGSYFRSYLKPGSIPQPVYNEEDDALYDIIPAEYKFPSGVVDPLRLGENDTNTYDSETEKIEANMPKATDAIRSNTVKIPFKGKAKVTGHNNIEYFYNPTEVRARLNEWRFQHNIDPTKYYSNEELQQIIDKDIENNEPNSFDLYKVIQGRGDLLKKLHDTYVSTGDKENPDEMPKAQRGLRKDKDKNKVKKGKTLFGRPYQIVETEAGPDLWGNERPGETTRVKTVYYKNGNIAKQKIDNNENGVNEVTYHDKDGKVTAEKTGDGYRTFSNGYFDYINNVDYETTKRRKDEVENISPKNKLDGFIQRAKLNLENMSSEGSQPGDSYNTVWPDWENDRFNYTREKNPGVRKSSFRFQGGGLPNDYQDFLGYSETAPDNRRPNAEWQYGNPRQYDHYGMWDALGKPKNFEEALQKNPYWQRDPGDGDYHGFSTNPDTGVWLKSHIPGESHPGDTGWMEYKDFMLSNDPNWNSKNQNLVFDPEIQRMRYVERKKQGGSLPKAQGLGDIKLDIPTNLQQKKLPTPSINFNPQLGFNIPKQFELGDFTTHRVPSVYNAVKSGDPHSMEEAIDKYFGYPQDRAFQYVDSRQEGDNDPSDNERHGAAGLFTQQAIKNKIDIPIIGDAAGWLGANAMGIGHELGTIFEDERPWGDKLQEAGEDIFNNFTGSTLGVLPGSQDEKLNVIHNLSVGNWLPDGVVWDGGKNNLYLKDEQGKVNRDSAMDMYNRMFQKKQGGVIKQVKIKSLPKAQTEGQFTPGFQTSYDVSKSMAENLELNRRANVMGWNSVADYKKSGWGQNELALKQRALINNPQVQQIAKTAAEMRPDLANVQARQDQVYADRRAAGDKTVAQIHYALSNPVEAAGHALKYGYVPQGNVGNYGQRQDGDAFSDVTQMLNPYAWGNAAYRLSHDLTNKDSWTTGAGGLNMGLDFLESVPLLGEIAAGARPTLQAIARSPLVSGFHDLAASPRSYGPTYLQTLKNTGENILTRTGEVKNIIRPPKLSTNDASLYDAGKSEKMLKYIFDPKFRKGSGEWDIKFWDWFHSPNEGEVLQRIANKLDYPVNLSSLGDMKGGFGTVVPTTHDASKLVKFGTLLPWEAEAPGIFSKLDEIGKLNTDPYIGLPVKSHIFPNLKLDIAFNKGDGSLVQVLNKVPGVPLRKFATTSPENLQFLKNSLTDETIQSARNRLSFLQKNNLGVDWQNPDNFLFDPTTGEMGIVDIAAMPRKVTGPEGGGIRWFNSLGSDYGDIYEKAMGAVMGDPTRAAMKIRPVIDQVKPVMERMPNYSYILERQGYPSIWKKNPQSKPVWESAFEAQTALPGLRTLFSNLQKAKAQVPGLGSTQTPTPPLIPRITGFNKREGGMTSTKGKKKQPGFQVLTDANGKYVFVKT